MKTNVRVLLLVLLPVFGLPSCAEEEGWTSLLDENLSQWDRYLSYSHEVGYDGQQPVDQHGNLIAPIGLNQEGYGVFTMIQEDQAPVLRVSGEVYGCVISKQSYSNYHLRLQVKWGEKKWDPRKNLLMDSGVLYHSIGDYGIDHWRSWMLSQEFQIMEGHMGDYWGIANSAIDIRAFIPEYIMNPVADPGQDFLKFGAGEELPGFCLRSASYEKPRGEWNTLELICYEDKSLHLINGEVVMVLRNSRYVQDGESFPLTRGKIQLQSEAAEVYFKSIEIRPLETLPERFRSLF
ncbi:MAG: DUF1080 domain-containing protein [Bacteroidales bacterium]|nr:DUF1080 domain-containing protein [Bacteroidales bacterium]